MNGPIVIFPLAGSVYLAKNDRGLSAEGATPEEALANLRGVTERWLVEYRKTAMTAPTRGDNPWLGWTGSRDPDDPVMEEWRRAVREYRDAKDAGEAVS